MYKHEVAAKASKTSVKPGKELVRHALTLTPQDTHQSWIDADLVATLSESLFDTRPCNADHVYCEAGDEISHLHQHAEGGHRGR